MKIAPSLLFPLLVLAEPAFADRKGSSFHEETSQAVRACVDEHDGSLIVPVRPDNPFASTLEDEIKLSLDDRGRLWTRSIESITLCPTGRSCYQESSYFRVMDANLDGWAEKGEGTFRPECKRRKSGWRWNDKKPSDEGEYCFTIDENYQRVLKAVEYWCENQ
jgi:hypothetical protein